MYESGRPIDNLVRKKDFSFHWWNRRASFETAHWPHIAATPATRTQHTNGVHDRDLDRCVKCSIIMRMSEWVWREATCMCLSFAPQQLLLEPSIVCVCRWLTKNTYVKAPSVCVCVCVCVRSVPSGYILLLVRSRFFSFNCQPPNSVHHHNIICHSIISITWVWPHIGNRDTQQWANWRQFVSVMDYG